MHFSARRSITLVEAGFSHILCPHVGCLDVLSPTEGVQLDVLLLTILVVWHCKRGLNASVGL